MGVAGINSNMAGYKAEYQVWANLHYEDGTIKRIYQLPRTSGTGENPDVGTSSTQQFLDITNPIAVDWYMNYIWDQLIDIGIDGIKIDFCETMPNEGWLHDNSTGKDFYLEYDWYDDTIFADDEVHHGFSTYFISLFYQRMNEMKAEKGLPDGFVVLSRGGGIGSQRNPYLWEGDQARTFEKIEDQLIALINTGISGIPFITYDMAGYAYSSNSQYFKTTVEAESAIFARAIEFTAFTSNIQTHGDVRHVYQMTEEVQELAALYMALHDDLAGYLRELSKIACDTGLPMVRHMILEYQEDPNVADIDDQYMYGDALLVAPILTCNTKTQGDNLVLDYASVVTRTVYLPAGEWIDLNTGETIVSAGETITVEANLAKIPVYLNTASEYAEELQSIFAGDAWAAIQALANKK
jgi:alpha-glucosidase (family GH31 glycosyl hydrolase)